MNGTQVKCLLVMIGLAVTGLGPISLTCLIGLYVVIATPDWFYQVVTHLYRNRAHRSIPPSEAPLKTSHGVTGVKIKCCLGLLILLILSIAPVPVAGAIGMYVVIMRPRWFKELVEKLYGNVSTLANWSSNSL
jgi:hypothetical protein